MKNIPKLFKDKAIFNEGTYSRYTLLWSNRDEHMCREVTLCEDDRGYTVVFGSCSCSYGGSWDNWSRVNMGTVTDWEALVNLVESMVNKESVSIWKEDDRS